MQASMFTKVWYQEQTGSETLMQLLLSPQEDMASQRSGRTFPGFSKFSVLANHGQKDVQFFFLTLVVFSLKFSEPWTRLDGKGLL